jgi:hypothetical protein
VHGSCCGSRVLLLLHLLEHSPLTPVAKLLIKSPSSSSLHGLLFILARCSSCHDDTTGDIFSAASGQARVRTQMPMPRRARGGSARF